MKEKVILYLLAISLYLGIYKGHVALLEHDRTTPVTVYPYPVSIFTEKDQRLLTEGIEIKTEAEVTKHLDDFLS